MKKTRSKVIVIDASVAQAAGSTGRSKPVRDFLTEVYQVCHHAIATPEIMEEWRRHSSQFFCQWRTSMHGRKKIERKNPPEIGHLRSEIAAVSDKAKRESMEKDIHLVEAALATDRIIVSLDNEAKGIYRSILAKQNIRWINPLKDSNPISALSE